MSEPTPGPWQHAHRPSPVDGMYRTEVFSAEHGVVAVCAWTPHNIGNGVTATYREANARLIAAAPEMLAALRRAVLALAFAAESSPAMQDDYAAVSAAIDRATGRKTVSAKA